MYNILFVDDDEDLLNGFKRALRKKKDIWNVYFSLDPNKALKLLTETKMNVVVSDMKMPSMYGATFLSIVNKKHPDTIRFILSGQSDNNAIFNSLKPSHQFICKPCSTDDIIFKIEGVLNSSKFLTNDLLKERINDMNSLPTMPHLYIQLEKELKNDNYTLDTIADIISADLAMSTQILKIINSSYFGFKKEISSIKQAVSFIGMDYIKNITLVTKVFESGIKNSPFTKSLYLNSISQTTLNKVFAERLGFDKIFCANLYLISMLQNVGILIIEKIYPEMFVGLKKHSIESLNILFEREKETFQGNHYLIGAYLLCLWGIKELIIESIAYWNTPEESLKEHQKMTYLLYYINSNLLNRDFDEEKVSRVLDISLEKLKFAWENANAEGEC